MTENPRHIAAYGLSYFFLFAAVAVLFPLFPLLLQEKGLSLSRIGFVMGTYDMVSILGLMILGHFFDKIRSPRRTVILICLASCLLLFAIGRAERGAGLFLLTLGLGFVVKSPTALVDALYGQTMRRPEESYGRARHAGSLGFFLSAGLIQLTGLVRGDRPGTVFAGYALCLAAAVFLIAQLPTKQLHRHPEETHSPFRETLRNFPRLYWIGLGVAFLNSLGLAGHYTFFSLLLKNRFLRSDVSGFWAIGPLFELPLFFFSGWLLQRLSLRSLWLICLAAGVVRMQVYSLATTLLPLYLVQVLHSFSFGLNHLCMMTLITRYTRASSRGLAMSLYTAMGMGLALFTGGMLGGVLLRSGDFPLLYQIFSLFPFLGACLALLCLKESPLKEEG